MSRVERVKTGRTGFVSVIANVPVPVELVITQFTCQVRIRLISQLIESTIRVLQKLIKYFNLISTSLVLPSAGVLLVTFVLNLKDSEFLMLLSGSFL